jgi:hypothetical protein
VEAVVTQPVVCQRVQRRRLDRAAESAGGAEAHVVEQHHHDVRRASRRQLSRNWTFSPTMSIGAGDSDLTWELSPQFVYDCDCGFDVRVGYRNLNYDFEKGSDSMDLTIKGPVIGVGFSF